MAIITGNCYTNYKLTSNSQCDWPLNQIGVFYLASVDVSKGNPGVAYANIPFGLQFSGCHIVPAPQ